MTMQVRFPTKLAAVAILVLGACGDDAPDRSASTVPTSEQLAAALLSVDQLTGSWRQQSAADVADVTDASDIDRAAAALIESGIVTDETRALLPRAELCDRASTEARAAVETLPWQAFRALDLDVDDPVDPPGDRSGHMIFLQEFLLAGAADEIETTFALLRDGTTACLGDIPAGDEGPGTATAIDVPDVGDDAFGVLTVIAEAGGWAEWRLHDVIVRQGPVLMSLSVVDIRAGVDPYYTVDDIVEMARIAAGNL